MKNWILFGLIVVFMSTIGSLRANDTTAFTPSGKVTFKVFFNYHYDFTEGVEKASVFEIKRTYFGYKYNFSKNISSRIMLDVGENESGSAYTAYLKYAHLDWKVASPLTLTFGLMPSKQFDDQEDHWGYRYLYKSFQDEFSYGSSAEMGINAEVKYTSFLSSDFFFLNGEGYTNLQDDFGLHLMGANIVYEADFGLTLKAYGSANMKKQIISDTLAPDTNRVNIVNVAFFGGYKNKHMRIAAEYNLMKNGESYKRPYEGKDQTGITVYGTYIINKKWELFGNYMNLSSNILPNKSDGWNSKEDGHIVLVGSQFSPVKGVKISLNYRLWLLNSAAQKDINEVFVNFEYKL